VATSLCAAEAVPKCIGLLEVRNEDYRMQPIKLKTVRPFLIEDICLADEGMDPEAEDDEIEPELKLRVDRMILKAKKGLSRQQLSDLEKGKSTEHLPLIRLRVDITGGYRKVNIRRFGLAYVDKVANPEDILSFTKRRTAQVKDGR